MSCCAEGLALSRSPPTSAGETGSIELIVPDVHCAACIGLIESAVAKAPGVSAARLNLSTRRLAVWHDGRLDAEEVIGVVERLGYACRPFDATAAGCAADDLTGRELLLALAIAGFAAANVMLLSVSVWSGADATTRDLFHWLSALIALPAVAIAGRPFYRSAFGALRRGRLNMDVPISLAVLLAAGLSLKVAVEGGEAAFFDASVALLFFLLIGRYLDHRTRARARDAVTRLLSLWSDGATRIGPDGPTRVEVDDIAVGDLILVEAGGRVPVDGIVKAGVADLDVSALTGESAPRVARPGSETLAGALALTGPLTIEATATRASSYLAEAVRLMEGAESGRARYVRLADKAARVYAPAVHAVALAAFLGQLWLTGDWGYALWVAVSVLIITCPCALGLAVPAVQTVASGALFRQGVLMKDGGALERLAEIDHVVFDKTGTLTLGAPRVVESDADEEAIGLAGALAASSRHPLAVALARSGKFPARQVSEVVETPGCGLEGMVDRRRVRIGSARFCGVEPNDADAMETWIQVDDAPPASVRFDDRLRPGAQAVIQRFASIGFEPVILSGDRAAPVAKVAAATGATAWRAEQSPVDKIAYLTAAREAGHRPLMVGDGVNDAPALAAAHVSIAPASASDIGRAAADFVITGDDLSRILFAHRIARTAKRLVLQNFLIAASYNAVAIPIAVLGYASPLAAAIAMSMSSILVTLNSLRLASAGRASPPEPTPAMTRDALTEVAA